MLEGITTHHIRDFCSLWCDTWSISAPKDLHEWERTAQGATAFIAQSWGGNNPSPFKRAAASAMSIVACAPIEAHIPPKMVEKYALDEQIARGPKMLRALVGHSFAEYVLKNSKIGDCSERTALKNPLKMSPHFYKDFLWLLSRSEFSKAEMCGPISLIYEALAYQTNPNAQDPVVA
jgi:hypothetical protein